MKQLKSVLNLSAALAALGLVGGCSSEALPPDAGSAESEHDGRALELVGPIAAEVVPPGPSAVIRPLGPLTDEPVVPRPLRDWSREELAERLRPAVALGDGQVYVAREPDWAAADAVLADTNDPAFVDPRPESAALGAGAVGKIEEPIVFGTDNRRIVTNTTVSPYNAIVKLNLYTGNTLRGHCTGFYIGSRTLLTAAHCLVFSNTDRVNRIIFEPARNGNARPYGSFDCRLDDTNRNNDFVWRVPSGYLIGQALELDYAVIDTAPCHRAPAWFNGYYVNAGNDTYTTYGYPDRCPGASADDNYLCGMSGASYINGWMIETEVIDATPGQSGSPWYKFFDRYRPVGVLKGYRQYIDLFRCGFDVCRRNYARHIDTAFSDFIRANSVEY